MTVTVKHIEIPKNTRILVTSDIHGHLTLFKRLLKKVGFSSNDMLFIVGDILDKGPESLKTLRFVMELHKKYNVIVSLGNVDISRFQMLEDLDGGTCEEFYQYLLRMRSWWKTNIFDEMAEELGIELDSLETVVASKTAILENFKEEYDFLRSLPAIVETQNYIFVHSGLPCEDLESLKEKDIYNVLKFNDFMSAGISFKKYVVVGHWPVTLYNEKIRQANPVIDQKQHIISIDGGCGLKEDGQLNMLIIPEIDCSVDDITSIYCDDFDVLEALVPQKESADSINIRYTDNRIRVLERGEEFSYCEHMTSGYRLKIYNKHIYELEDETTDTKKCEDYTDYLLPVDAGDRMSLIYKTSKGYLMKKNGVTGWYKGKLKYGDCPYND